MEISNKVVVIHVYVPEELNNCDFRSKPFTIEVNGVKTTWVLECYSNCSNESYIGVFLRCNPKTLGPLHVCYSFHLISNNKTTEISGKSFYSQFTSSKPGWGLYNFVSHEYLLDNSSDLFIRRKICIVVKIRVKILSFGGIPPIKVASSSGRLKALFESMNHSDMIIKSSDGVKFEAHKAIICASSQVLNRMFSSQMKESLTGVLKIDDRSEVVNTLIRFIYCGDFADEFNDIKDVDIDLYHAAERYELEDLKIVCLKSIYKKLEVANALEIAEFAKLFNLKKLYSCCLLMIYANFALVSQSDEWNQLDKSIISDDIMQKSLKLYGKELWTSDDF